MSSRFPKSGAERARDRERERYETEVGPAETRFPDDPDWEYRGTKAEREALEERVAPVVIEGQEEMFGG